MRLAALFCLRFALLVAEVVSLPILVILAIISRVWPKKVDIGLGPEPLINNVYHKRALEKFGYKTETFVDHLYFITQEFDWCFASRGRFETLALLAVRGVFVFSLFQYRALYVYFNGGPLFNSLFLWRLEPFLYILAGVKIVVMPYGGDVQEMTRSNNLSFKHAMSVDYPGHRFRRTRIAKRIDLWTRYASHVIGGCEWVDYMYHWDTLMLAHFSIDLEVQKLHEVEAGTSSSHQILRVLHAPNHRAIKGTDYITKAVREIQAQGLEIELVLLERRPNHEVLEAIAQCDVVVDQLIIGWYAMFAIEGMAMGKPVVCNLRPDLVDLYVTENLLLEDEIPLIHATPRTIKDVLLWCIKNRDKLKDIGMRGPQYVRRHHSIEAVGAVFNRINRSIGLVPSLKTEAVSK